MNESEGSLDVYLIEAKDLPTTDESGLCDPFVILTVEPKVTLSFQIFFLFKATSFHN